MASFDAIWMTRAYTAIMLNRRMLNRQDAVLLSKFANQVMRKAACMPPSLFDRPFDTRRSPYAIPSHIWNFGRYPMMKMTTISTGMQYLIQT